MGVVYRALDERLGRDVALKLLPPRSAVDHDAKRRLQVEARTAAAIHHPNIAAIFEAGEADGHTYFAMELIDGKSVRELIASGAGDFAERMRWALDLARALAAIHQAGWIHRDIKPENAIVARSGAAKLLDFGLARGALQSASADARAGTVRYMSPEQARGDPLDPRTDVFAFGMLLHELLTGRTCNASSGRGPTADRRALASADRRSAPALASWLDRCSSADPDRRPRDGAEIVATLEAILARRARSTGKAWVWGSVAAIAIVTIAQLSRSEVPKVAPGPSRRLTAHRLESWLSDAAISRDGRRFAVIDPAGLAIGDVAHPSPQHVAGFEQAGAVEALGDGWAVQTSSGADGEVFSLRDPGLEAERRELLYRGQFKFASVAPDRSRIAMIESGKLVIRGLPAGAIERTLAFGANRWASAVRWSPDGRWLGLSFIDWNAPGRAGAIEVLDATDLGVRLAIASYDLMMPFGHAAFSWAPSGELLYARAIPAGEGNGTTIWTQRPDGEPIMLDKYERQSISALSLGGEGSSRVLLSLRDETSSRLTVLEIETGAMSTASESDFDQRPSAWASPDDIWQMSVRDLVPEASLRKLDGSRVAIAGMGGWAQSWPVGARGGVLYWRADGPDAVWKLVWNDSTVERDVLTPVSPRERLATVRPAPTDARFRCAGEVCVLGLLADGEIIFYRLDLDGGPARALFTVHKCPRYYQVWDFTAESGGEIAVAHTDGTLEIFGLDGGSRRTSQVRSLRVIQSVAYRGSAAPLYLAGIGAEPELFRVVEKEGDEERVRVKSTAVSYGDVLLSPDGKRLAFVARSFDTDVWVSELRGVTK